MSNAFEELVLANPKRWALFLDIDGTLIEVAAEPSDVHVPHELPGILAHLSRSLDGALALNTGRQVGVVDHLLAPQCFPASGVHGVELRLEPVGSPEVLAPPVPAALVERVVQMAAGIEGILFENKSVALALHYRHAPEQAEVLKHRLAAVLAHWPAYELKGGRMVFECLPRGFSKGTAIQRFMEYKTFEARLPIVIGDDRGDEPAIEIARSLGGLGLTVAGEYFPRAEADFPGAAAVREALARLSGALML